MVIRLVYVGFHKVDVNQKSMPGDIAVTQAENAVPFEGHVCIYSASPLNLP